MNSRIIRSEAEINDGLTHLCSVEPRFSEAAELTGPLPLRRRDEGFTTLLDIIVSQQLSVASADAIWARMENAGFTRQSDLCDAGMEELRECGLSRQKAEYAIALARSGLNYSELSALDDGEVVERLVKIRGIGVWTAEIYAMSALGRSDVMAAGDLALQESAKLLFGLECRPSAGELRAMAEPWSPWRAVASRLLWAYYRVASSREGIR